MYHVKIAIFTFLILLPSYTFSQSLPATVKKVKQSVVGVGVYDPLGSPRNKLQGTGFAIGNGRYIATNYHVVAKPVNVESTQFRAVFVGVGRNPKVSKAEIIASDPAHDLAILKITDSVPALNLETDNYIDDGTEVAFTGYPIGAVLGLYPATHKGLISTLTPVATPSINADKLSIEMLQRLRDPYFIYQMDATAYPGNSGSPVYNIDTGKVIAVINKVFVKRTKENVLSDPSDISYSIPIRHLRALAKKVNVDL